MGICVIQTAHSAAATTFLKTAVTPDFSSEASNFLAQLQARPAVKNTSPAFACRMIRPSDDSAVVGEAERG
jgi:hypothetical protein